MVRHSGKTLGKNIRTNKVNMILRAPKIKVRAVPLKQILLESVLLLADPGEGQPRRQMDTGRSLFANVQFPTDGCEGQDVVKYIK